MRGWISWGCFPFSSEEGSIKHEVYVLEEKGKIYEGARQMAVGVWSKLPEEGTEGVQ